MKNVKQIELYKGTSRNHIRQYLLIYKFTFLTAREMEITESSENNFNQNQNSKTEGNVLEARRTRGGSRRSRGRRSESVSDLEAEETKGFMDLGFVFTEDDLNSELPEILPGLRTFLHREEQSKTKSSVTWPYLSEAYGSFKVISGLKEQRKIQWI